MSKFSILKLVTIIVVSQNIDKRNITYIVQYKNQWSVIQIPSLVESNVDHWNSEPYNNIRI